MSEEKILKTKQPDYYKNAMRAHREVHYDNNYYYITIDGVNYAFKKRSHIKINRIKKSQLNENFRILTK